MNRILIVVDMQNDFISGSLGSPRAQAIVSRVCEKIRSFDGEVLFTRDSHGDDYLSTQEGKNLPVPHCIRGTWGWELEEHVEALRKTQPVDKETFGSAGLGELLREKNRSLAIDEIVLVGLCTDICVISNAMVSKAFLPETKITVDSSCCAGVTGESHETALQAMAACQISII